MYKFQGFNTEYEKAKITIIPVPYDSTTSYIPGTRDGPDAILKASINLEFYDIETKQKIDGIYTKEPLERNIYPEEMIKKVEREIEREIKNKKFPILLGGEHSLSIGFSKALKKHYKNFSVLQIDAHSDLRDSYEGSKFNHACTMRRIWEIEKNIIGVGIRSMSYEEAKFIEKEKIKYYDKNFDIKKILKELDDKVYITLDLDGLDPSEMPSVGTPEPSGLSYEKTISLLKEIIKNKKIIGFDLMELKPIPGNIVGEFTAAKILQKFIAYYKKYQT